MEGAKCGRPLIFFVPLKIEHVNYVKLCSLSLKTKPYLQSRKHPLQIFNGTASCVCFLFSGSVVKISGFPRSLCCFAHLSGCLLFCYSWSLSVRGGTPQTFWCGMFCQNLETCPFFQTKIFPILIQTFCEETISHIRSLKLVHGFNQNRFSRAYGSILEELQICQC